MKIVKLMLSAAMAASWLVVSAQSVVLMPDSTNNRVVSFDATTGALIDSNMFGLAGGTPISAISVGDEIWVSEQVGDRISRWDWDGNSLGAITGGLDNVRGITLIGDTIYAANAGTQNGAPGASLVMFNSSGLNLGHIATAGLSPSPFYALESNGSILVSSSSANDDVHRYSMTGTSMGTFYNGPQSFGEQMDHSLDGNVWVGWFSSDLVTLHNPTTGALLSSFAADSVRGVFQLANGNVMWSNGTGVFVWDAGMNQSTQVYAGGGRFFSEAAPIPEPATMLVLGGGALLAFARKRRKQA